MRRFYLGKAAEVFLRAERKRERAHIKFLGRWMYALRLWRAHRRYAWKGRTGKSKRARIIS